MLASVGRPSLVDVIKRQPVCRLPTRHVLKNLLSSGLRLEHSLIHLAVTGGSDNPVSKTWRETLGTSAAAILPPPQDVLKTMRRDGYSQMAGPTSQGLWPGQCSRRESPLAPSVAPCALNHPTKVLGLRGTMAARRSVVRQVSPNGTGTRSLGKYKGCPGDPRLVSRR